MERISINLLTTGETPVCHVSQFDIGRTIRFDLISDSTGEAYTLTGTEEIKIKIRKPDGTETTEDIENTSGNYVDFTTSEETCDQSGINICELSISKDGATIGTKNFKMKVEADAYDGVDIVTESASGTIATFETNIIENLVECKCNINPVQSGTGTPSPQNVRPISGFSALNVTRTGKNILPKLFTQTTTNGVTLTPNPDGTLSFSGVATSACFFIRSFTLKAGSYIFSTSVDETFTTFDTYISKDGTTIARGGNNASPNSFTLTEDSSVTITVRVRQDVNTDGLKIYPMIRLSSDSDTTYEPYNGQTATVNFGQTVYKGKANLTDGNCIVSYGLITLTGQETGALYDWGGYTFNNSLFEGSNTYIEIIKCSHTDNLISGIDFFNSRDSGHDVSCTISNFSNVRFRNRSVGSTLADYQAWLRQQVANGTPVQIVAKLVTPIEITTTPENLTAISGENNVYGDTGDISVKYYKKA